MPHPDTTPYLEWVGFTVCVDIPTTQKYTIGMAGDDAVRIGLNGQSLVELIGSGYQWPAWRIFEIDLTAGNNVFTIEGFNGDPGSPALFGFEIYNTTNSVLTGLTSASTLEQYIVFSTRDLDGVVMDLGTSGLTCPAGFTYDPCLQICTKESRINPTTDSECCNPCSTTIQCSKAFQDDECFYFQDAIIYEFQDNIFSGSTTLNYSNCCGDDKIDLAGLMTQPLSAVTTIEDFEYFLTSELIDAKNRQTISGYPTLRALYDRYMNSGLYCGNNSSRFDYMTMDQFAGLVGNYWVDIVEQVIPATTIWGSTRIYSNTIFDQQKFKYKAYSSLFCSNPYSGETILSPINGTSGQCTGVSVSMTTMYVGSNPTS